jgi:hypothetical protein
VVDVERLIGEEHGARAIWEFVGRLDMSGYREEVRAVEGKAGRPGWEPRLLISLWVYAYSEGVGSARAIEELCEWEPGYPVADRSDGGQRAHAVGLPGQT